MRRVVLAALAALLGSCSTNQHTAGSSGDVASSTNASGSSSSGSGGEHATCPEATGVPPTDEVLVAGDPGAALGIFDPSLVYPARAPGGAMAYSAVPTQETIVTRIALSADHGASWTYVAQPNVAGSPGTELEFAL